jgi:predicted ATPase/DNA-binding SARP family transcriptional activator
MKTERIENAYYSLSEEILGKILSTRSAMQTMLKITTLGGLGIELDEQPIGGFVSRKAEALLVYLTMHPREHPRETLGNLLWDDLSQTLSLSYLRTVLASLQKQLAPYLRVTRHSIAINNEREWWIDVVELNRVLETAHEQWEKHGDFTRATVAELEKVLGLYKGTFLEGFYVRNCRDFENWMLAIQERLRTQVFEAYIQLGRYYFQRKKYRPAIEYTDHALNIDSLSEEAHRQMMQVLAQSGQRSAALNQYETCKQILQEELGIEPDLETTALYEAILEGQTVALREALAPNTLPTFSTPFVDRPIPLAKIIGQLDKPECRLLTLIGPGGIGKTRLALEAARLVRTDFRDGVHFVSFTGVRDPNRILETILNALGVDIGGDSAYEDEIMHHLRDRQLLLVLDNFEYVLNNAEVLSHILQQTSQIKMLVTSRERLSLVEEWLYYVESMMVPDLNTPDSMNFPAIQLFIQTAQRMQPLFNIEEELKWVLVICRAVGGMPLAIELAASWTRMMSCEQIAGEVQRELAFLATTMRNMPERHRSIYAVFESSYNLLKAEEQAVFRQLSIFHGGFQQEAASAITGASLFTLSALLDKSLIRRVEWRYDIHELLRQYAKVKLEEHPDEERRLKQTFGTYFARFLEHHEEKLSRTLPDSKFEEVIREVENIRLAWQLVLEQGRMEELNQFLRPLFRLHDVQSSFKDAEQLFDDAVKKLKSQMGEGTALVIARAQVFQAACNFRMDRYDEAEALINVALPVLKQYHAEWELRFSLTMLGRSTAARGIYWQAQQYFSQVAEMTQGDERANALFRLASASTMLGEYETAQKQLADGMIILPENMTTRMNSLIIQGDLYVRIGKFKEAYAAFEQALQLSGKSLNNQAMLLADLSQALIALGNYEKAIEFCQQSVDQNRELHNRWGQSYGLLYLGRAYLGRGEIDVAERCFKEGIQICQQTGIQTTLIALLRQQATVCTRRGQLELAAEFLCRALKTSRTYRLTPLMLDTLTGFAQLQRRDSIQLASYVICHPAAMFETRQEAQHLLQTLNVEVLDMPNVALEALC